MDRISILRGPTKTVAEKEIAIYKLGKGDKCIERVNALFDKNYFIFPGVWGIHPRTGKAVCDEMSTCFYSHPLICWLKCWNLKASEPFLNPGLVETLKTAFFLRPKSIGYDILNKCGLSVDKDDRNEPELPVAIVALAAAGVRVILSISLYVLPNNLCVVICSAL
jgi:Domain of unknown function (DUF6532)